MAVETQTQFTRAANGPVEKSTTQEKPSKSHDNEATLAEKKEGAELGRQHEAKQNSGRVRDNLTRSAVDRGFDRSL